MEKVTVSKALQICMSAALQIWRETNGYLDKIEGVVTDMDGTKYKVIMQMKVCRMENSTKKHN